MIVLFGRFESKRALRATYRNLQQASAVLIATYWVRTTDYCSRAYANFAIEIQLSPAIKTFIANIANVLSQNYLQQDNARRTLSWQAIVRSKQTSQNARVRHQTFSAATISNVNNGVSTASMHEKTNTSNTAAQPS